MLSLPEFWASPEPTVARIDASCVRDQIVETGHACREDDIDRLATLGVTASRYPVLWERVAPETPDRRDYRWTDRRLQALKNAGVEPIVTLLHHGSGPAYTDLLDPNFPTLFADYAAATARRYPWIKRWTPINEPLTTARFATLYGAWYPNRRFDHAAFARAVVNQAAAIALACRRISDVVADASFMLTEDLQSFTAADERIADYARHKGERMYLSTELLQGRIVDGHPMYRYLRQHQISAAELGTFSRDPCPPDVVGWNYYPNSERWLASDGDGHRNDALVDIAPRRLALLPLLCAAYDRLRLPFALSEVHVLGNEGERARWLLQRLDDALAARNRGIPIVAFGAWAAFGMVDWTSLLCRNERRCEDGIYTFAGTGGTPERTLVADVLTTLCAGVLPAKPEELAWWERDSTLAA